MEKSHSTDRKKILTQENGDLEEVHFRTNVPAAHYCDELAPQRAALVRYLQKWYR
jgi:hypothetical protein